MGGPESVWDIDTKKLGKEPFCRELGANCYEDDYPDDLLHCAQKDLEHDEESLERPQEYLVLSRACCTGIALVQLLHHVLNIEIPDLV